MTTISDQLFRLLREAIDSFVVKGGFNQFNANIKQHQ